VTRRPGESTFIGRIDVPDPERLRLAEDAKRQKNWKRWGPYLSERQWGTVREDYSPHGSAWDSFPHEHARSRAYRWGEDGLMGISDRHQYVCFAVALWNGRDPILKERLFGVTGPQGNHGEDVKEAYYYLDSTPTHSYMKYLYKYPQREFPYRDLVETNRGRSRQDFEYELIDTGIFNDNRYFDVFVEYAKEDPEDILIRVTVHNRGPEDARIHVLPTLWFRNTWSWKQGMSKPNLRADHGTIKAPDPESGEYTFSCDGEPELLFTENESNVDVQLVQLPVAVIDRDGRAVNGLTKQSFEVFEDGVQQEITFFRREDIPVSVGLLIDNSASMHNKRQRVNAAALAFARESNPQDETSIVGFDDEVFLDQDFTNNIDDLTKAFSKIDTRGQTAVYDAISLSVNHVRQGRKDKKALLLISDGEDNASRYNFETALEALRKSDVLLYARRT
jgi:von Willebrand factor type A domain